ncbi:hypothetical protein hmeg3_21360 [Herbaspirillum sp. meg3]|uniref:glycosyltransferase family 2 protein n=1 Tax=Herbaspirillum sp. meg3 TaxID=2025949 RepID=UPI000B986ED1|nr:glycosyltransferase family A protein [Herbaspirillum sp. meg3]ASU40593.1 hypothetical protein hmeg3_21360 [Herbaspirillum sp. meg3]
MTLQAGPLVTIGLPIYNAEATLADAISSIINQSYTNWELLLLDDGSVDGGAEIAAAFPDQRIRWISDGNNRGISYRLNQAVELARGEYFCRMDADDICFPQRLEKQLAFLEANHAIDLVAAAVLTFDTQGAVKGVVSVAASHETICRKPWNGFHFPHPTWFGRINWFRQYKYNSAADGAEDQWLLYSTYQSSTFAGLSDVLLGYRDDRNSFKKLLNRRLSFWRSIGWEACRRARLADFAKVSLVQPMKIAADFLHVRFGIARLRNQQQAVDVALLDIWEEVLVVVKKTREEKI